MNRKVERPDHLFVKNPLTGKLVNVLPLFELMDNDVYSTDGVENLRLSIQAVHDFISTQPPGSNDECNERATMSFTLISFRKTFERMREIEP